MPIFSRWKKFFDIFLKIPKKIKESLFTGE